MKKSIFVGILALVLMIGWSSCNSNQSYKSSNIQLTERSKQLISLFLEKGGDYEKQGMDHIIMSLTKENDQQMSLYIQIGEPDRLYYDVCDYPYSYVGYTRYKGYDILAFDKTGEGLLDEDSFSSLFWTEKNHKSAYYVVLTDAWKMNYDPDSWDITIQKSDTLCDYIMDFQNAGVTKDEINAILHPL